MSTKKVGLDPKWLETINASVDNPAWNTYDCFIQMTVATYNNYLRGKSGFQPLDWLLIKAITWVETNPNTKQWKSNVMQIGKPGDPGMQVFLAGKEGSDLIIPPEFKSKLNAASVVSIPSCNIQAGVGYLLTKLANFAIKDIPDSDTKTYEITVKAGDTLDSISKKEGTTINLIKKNNPGIAVLKIGQKIKYQKGALKKDIVGWKPITTLNIALHYNGHGDRNYSIKLDYALSLIRNGKNAVCTQ